MPKEDELKPSQADALHKLEEALHRCVMVRVPSKLMVDAIDDIARVEIYLAIKRDERFTPHSS
jgi:hypothetical protein